MKKRILIVSDYFLPHWTGIAKAMEYFTIGLKDQYDITVLTVRINPGLKKDEKVAGISIFRTDPVFSFSRSMYSLEFIFLFSSIVRNYDLIFINSPCVNIVPIALVAKL